MKGVSAALLRGIPIVGEPTDGQVLLYDAAGRVLSWGAAGGGTSFVWKGTWNSGTAYVANDVVAYNGTSYIATSSNTNNAPPSAVWSTMAQKGDTGATGAAGPAPSGTGLVYVDGTAGHVEAVALGSGLSVSGSYGARTISATATPAVGSGSWSHLDTTHSPVGLWRFDGDLTDSSGGGRNLSLATGTARYMEVAPGLRGLWFDGSTVLARPSYDAALAISGDLTIEFILWADQTQNTGAGSNGGTIMRFSNDAGAESGTNNAAYHIDVLNPVAGDTQMRAHWEHNNAGDNTILDAGHRPGPFQPFHFAFTRSGANGSVTAKFYINGIYRSSLTLTAVPAAPNNVNGSLLSPFLTAAGATQLLSVGGKVATPSTYSAFFRGGLASLKIIGSALTDSQVLSEANKARGLA